MPHDMVLMVSLGAVGGLTARLLRLPPLVGLLVAGFALSGLGVEGGAGLDLLADLGVMLLLFGIGLKLDVRGLARREVLGVAVGHMVVTAAVTLGLLALVGVAGVALFESLDTRSLVLVALALSFSSTVVAVTILQEQNAVRSLHGRTAIGILVVQDVVAVGAMVVVHGEPPRWWSVLLLALVPAAPLARRWLDGLDHGELLPLVAVALALVPGYAAFEAAGLEGDLGALVVGMLLAPAARSEEMSKSILSVKDLLLVAFFLSVGLHGTPRATDLGAALLLLLLVPAKTLLYAGLLRWSGFRVRTATHTSATLASFSEFALIVAAAGVAAGVLDSAWLVTIATAVALSFVLSAALSAAVAPLSRRMRRWWSDPAEAALHPEERPIDLGRAEALVLGMGRLGRAAYLRLSSEHGLSVVGVDSDVARVRALAAAGLDVLEGDATDPLFWSRVAEQSTIRQVVLAMPFHGSNVRALEQLERSGFGGSVTAVTRYSDEAEHLADRAGVVGLYDAAGAELADRAVATRPDPTAE